jgi:hypothetical protein
MIFPRHKDPYQHTADPSLRMNWLQKKEQELKKYLTRVLSSKKNPKKYARTIPWRSDYYFCEAGSMQKWTLTDSNGNALYWIKLKTSTE